jgi:predicted transcriptional regulator of viral defense system
MTRISYTDFQQKLANFPVFSLNDIAKIYPDFDSRRLHEWQKKNYIKKLVNKWYQFSNVENTEELCWYQANHLVQPSYISFESALSYYGFIPEGVFSITSVTTLKTVKIDTGDKNFIYRYIKPSRFFGYKIIYYQYGSNKLPIKFASPEKALLDYLYFNSQIRTTEDIADLRLNKQQIATEIDKSTLNNYLQIFNSKELQKRVNMLFIQDKE